MFDKIKRWWDRETLRHNRGTINHVLEGYSHMRRDEEIRMIVKKFMPEYHVHANPQRKEKGYDAL